MKEKRRQFFVLWCAGMAGVLSFLLVDLAALIRMVPVSPGEEAPTIPPLLAIISLIQPTVLLTLAVVVGIVLAPRVSLSSPIAESLAAGRGVWRSARNQIIPGIAGGVAGGLVIICISSVSRFYLPSEVATKSEEFVALMPLTTRLLYGGITEELLLRWGFLTFLVWLAWRIFQKRDGAPWPSFFVAAIIISSLVFGLGHLPIAYVLFPDANLTFTLFVVSANSVFGLIAGFLYWKKGLESAMIAHMVAHLVMFAASKVAV